MPDSNDVVVEAPKGFVTFKRSVSIRPYETATAEVMIQVPTDVGGWITEAEDGTVDVDVDKITADLKPAFFAAKTAVYEQLGLTFEVTPELVVMELLDAELGAVEVSPAEAKKVAETTSAGRQARKPSNSSGGGKKFPPAPSSKDELWEELAEHPERYWDNRDDKQSAGYPDFKRVEGGQGLWLEYKGNSNVPEGLEIPEDGFAVSAKK
jgi:hypothetical protein